MASKTQVLVVCHGNINRSALCAAILQSAAPDALEVRQGGFVNGGRRASKKMRDAALAHLSIDLDAHRSRIITREDLRWAHRVIYMDGGNLKRLQEMMPNGEPYEHQAWICLGHHHDPHRDRIPDPNYLPRGEEFDAVVHMIDNASRRLAKNLISFRA